MAFVVRADFHCPGGRLVEVNRRSPASSRLSATMSHVAPLVRATMANAPQPPLLHEGLAAGLPLGRGAGVDHVAPPLADDGLGEFVVQVPGRMAEEVAQLVDGAALDPEALAPQRGQPIVGKTVSRTVF